MRLTPLGEELIILEEVGDLPPSGLADWLESLGLAGVIEAAPAWNSVGLHLHPESFSLAELEEALADLQPEQLKQLQPKTITIPVCWELGEDLGLAAEASSLSVDRLVEILEAQEWPCRFIGFQPGFPYCGPLPPPLHQIPRLKSPRTRVPAGSVALAAGQLGIYPSESPGGWMLVGRTPLVICEPLDGFFPIKPGERICLQGITHSEFQDRLGERL